MGGGASPEGASSPTTITPPPCEECGEKPWKYRCPGCSTCTCSLPCVKSHKQRTGCTGQRNRTRFVPLSQFDDNLLLSDYNLLEETKRAAESARRMRCPFGGQAGEMGRRPGRFGVQQVFKLPFKLRLLRNAVFRRKARLLLQPVGMSKREKNQSRYDQRTKSIFWTIEWHFHLTDVILTDHGVDERMNLISIMEKHLKPTPWNHQLRLFCNEELHRLKFFLQKNPKDSRSPFRELNVTIPIGQQMTGITIVEYPVILVLLPTHSYGFEVEVDRSALNKDVENIDTQLSPKGSFFKEEEPEENEESSATRILDLIDYKSSYDKFQMARSSSFSDRTATATPSDVEVPLSAAERPMAASGIKDQACGLDETSENPNSNDNTLKFSISLDFDFEQNLRDVYSDLIGEINPDDFLCLDGDYGECEVEESKVVGSCGAAFIENELEEGEIPS